MRSVAEILRSAHTIAVVGLGSKRYRPSYGVAEYLQRSGYRIIPVNPEESEVLGEKSYPNLDTVPEAIDIVDIFRRSEFVPDLVEAAIRKHAKDHLDAGRRDPRRRRPPRPGSRPRCSDGPLHLEGPPAARIASPNPGIDEIMSRVAANQAKSVEARKQYVYHQEQLVSLHRANGKLAREEKRQYTVTPDARGERKQMTAFEGKYEDHGKLASYYRPAMRVRVSISMALW